MNKILLSSLCLITLALTACQSRESRYYKAIEELQAELKQQGNKLFTSSVKHGYALWLKKETSQEIVQEESSDGLNTQGMHIMRKDLESEQIDTLAYIEPYSVRTAEPWLSVSGDSLALIYEQENVGAYLIPLKQVQAQKIHFPLYCRAVSDSIYQGFMIHNIEETMQELMFIQQQSYNTSGICTNKSDSIEVFTSDGETYFEGLSLPTKALEDKDLRDRILLHYRSETIDNVFRYASDAKTLESRYTKGDRYRFLLEIKTVERTIDSNQGEPQWLLIGNGFAVITSDPRAPHLARHTLLVVAECHFNKTYTMRQMYGSNFESRIQLFSMFLSEKERRTLELASKISDHPIIFKNSDLIYIR